MHALCERTRSHNPTLWVVTTTGDQHCRALHGMSKRERNSGLRALPAHAPALKPPRKARFLFSKSSISLDCFPLFHRKPGFWSGFQARKARFSPPKPGFWSDFPARKSRFSLPKTGRNRTKNRPPKPLCMLLYRHIPIRRAGAPCLLSAQTGLCRKVMNWPPWAM